MSKEDIKKSPEQLSAEIEELKKKLAISEKEKTQAQEMAEAMAAADVFTGNTEERPTGKTITMRTCVNPAVKRESEQVWKDVKYPTYYYTIDLPAGAGRSLTTNGVDYYHGETYEFDPMTLADVKSRVARTWDHEKSIHGDNENAYRRNSQGGFGMPKLG